MAGADATSTGVVAPEIACHWDVSPTQHRGGAWQPDRRQLLSEFAFLWFEPSVGCVSAADRDERSTPDTSRHRCL